MITGIFSFPESPVSTYLFLWVWLISLPYLLSLHIPATETNSAPAINVTKYISFPNFDLVNPQIVHQIKLLGSAKFLNQNGAVQIPDETHVADLRFLAGRAIYSSPIRLLDPTTGTPASFETNFSFQFSNDTRSNLSEWETGSSNLGGSGLTFIIVPDEFTIGRSGKWLGMLNDACEDNSKTFGVEFDARMNPEVGDLNDNHVGINFGSVSSTVSVNASDAEVFLKDGSAHIAWISYDGQKKWIEIRLGSDGGNFPSIPIFSGPLDLSNHLNEYMFVGFSASTGNMTQFHYIHSWNFTSTSPAFLRIPTSETCENNVHLQNSSSQRTDKKRTKEPHAVFLILAGAVAVAALAVSLYFFCTSREPKGNSKLASFSEKKPRPRPLSKPKRFTLTEISTATQGFSEVEMLGSDFRGTYYRGKISGSYEIAVKRFATQFLGSQPGLDKKRILKEIGAIIRLRHPNLAPIRGWCHDRRELMVVYDFYINGSLDKWLFGVGVLPWTRRFKVIKDVADALSFLHSKQLAHKNMKTSSVFLDVSFRSLLGDFGFVLSATESKRFEDAVSKKADVFEFGIFVLEVVSGRKKLDSELGEGEKDLVDLAWRMHVMGEKKKLVDRRMGALVNLEQAIRVLDIGLLCTLNESKGRPCMEDIVEFLNLERPIPELPDSRPVALCPYNSATGLCTGYSCGSFN